MTDKNPMPAVYDALNWPDKLRPTADTLTSEMEKSPMPKTLLSCSKANVKRATKRVQGFDSALSATQFDLAVAAIQAQQAIAEAADAQVAATRAQTVVLERMERNGQTRTVGL